MELKTKRRLFAILPWLITIVVLAASLLFGNFHKVNHNTFETQSLKLDLVSKMRIHLLEATEAEKNAVLALTDKESEMFAVKARQAAENVENQRNELESLIQQGKHPKETQIADEFNICWSQYRKLDETILSLAVQNTNLKAQKISSTQCMQELRSLEISVNRFIQRGKTDKNCNEAATPAGDLLTASFNIFALHRPHIEEADDKQMDKLEQSITAYDETAKNAFRKLTTIIALKGDSDLTKAKETYDRFMNLTNEVLRLSRMNTNIKSVELSLGKKRLISSQCQENLATLQETIQAQGNYSLPRLKTGKQAFTKIQVESSEP